MRIEFDHAKRVETLKARGLDMAWAARSIRRANERERRLLARGFDPDTPPDLSRDGWPEKFAKASVRRGRPLKAQTPFACHNPP